RVTLAPMAECRTERRRKRRHARFGRPAPMSSAATAAKRPPPLSRLPPGCAPQPMRPSSCSRAPGCPSPMHKDAGFIPLARRSTPGSRGSCLRRAPTSSAAAAAPRRPTSRRLPPTHRILRTLRGDSSMHFPKRWLAGALLAVFALLPACNTTGGAGGGGTGGGGGRGNVVTGDTIPIGSYLSMTGSEADFGKQTNEGLSLAVDQINGSGGVKGKKIAIHLENDEGDPAKAASAVTKLITNDKVVAVVGEVASSLSLAAAPICQSNHVPMVTPSSTNVKVTQVGDYIFRVCFIDPFQAYVVAKFARGEPLKAQNAAIFTDSGSAYSKGLTSEFKQNFEQMGGKVVAEASYAASDTDYKGQ